MNIKTEKEIITEIKDFVDNFADANDLAVLWNYIFSWEISSDPAHTKLDDWGQSPITGDDISMGQ